MPFAVMFPAPPTMLVHDFGHCSMTEPLSYFAPYVAAAHKTNVHKSVENVLQHGLQGCMHMSRMISAFRNKE